MSNWKQEVQDRINKKRQEFHKKKYAEISEVVHEKLNDLVSLYFSSYCHDEEENTHNFGVLQQEWFDVVNKYKATKSHIIKMDSEAFSKAIEMNMNSEIVKESIKKMHEEADKAGTEVHP